VEIACRNQLLALCFGTVLVFFAQSMFCFAKHAGLVRCGIHAEQHQNCGDSGQQSQNPQVECCPMHSHTAVVPIDAVTVSIGDVLTDLILSSDSTVPDSPVREIDYPPQLS
jgi:hypothetical protein